MMYLPAPCRRWFNSSITFSFSTMMEMTATLVSIDSSCCRFFCFAYVRGVPASLLLIPFGSQSSPSCAKPDIFRCRRCFAASVLLMCGSPCFAGSPWDTLQSRSDKSDDPTVHPTAAVNRELCINISSAVVHLLAVGAVPGFRSQLS